MMKKNNVEFLESYLVAKQAQINELANCNDEEWEAARGEDLHPTTAPDDERCARLADACGLKGKVFRKIHPEYMADYENEIGQLQSQLETIPQIIARLEEARGDVTIPKDAVLITLSQLAVMLQMGESTLRDRNNRGLIPRPIRCGENSNLLWNRREIEEWIKAGALSRTKWEAMKGRVA